MIKPSRADLWADRWNPCAYVIAFRGVDLGAADTSIAAQVRGDPDAPGNPLIDLPQTTDATAQGVRYYFTDRTGSVPVSYIRVQVPQPIMAALPAAAELGDDVPLYWDFHVTLPGRTRARWLWGDFVVRAGVANLGATPLVDDPAPAPGMSFDVDAAGTTVVLSGLDLLDPIVADTKAAAAQATLAAQSLTDVTLPTLVILDPSSSGTTGHGDGGGFTLIEPSTFGAMGLTGPGLLDRFTVFCEQPIPGGKFKVLTANPDGTYTLVAEVTKDFPAGATMYVAPRDFTALPVTNTSVMGVFGPSAGISIRTGAKGVSQVHQGDLQGTATVSANAEQVMVSARVRCAAAPEQSSPAASRGHPLVAGAFDAGSTAAWTVAAPDAGYLQAVSAHIGQAGGLTIVVVDPRGLVSYLRDVTAPATGPNRFVLPSPLPLEAGSRVGLVQGTGKVSINNPGADSFFDAGGRPTFASKPTLTAINVTASISFDFTVAAAALSDAASIDAVTVRNRPLSRFDQGSGLLVTSFLGGASQTVGPIAPPSAAAQADLAAYGPSDPPAGPGSPMVFSRTGAIVVPAANGATVPAYRKAHAANPSVVTFNGIVYLYFRADNGTTADAQSIGCLSQPVAGFDPLDASRWTDHGVVVGLPGGGQPGGSPFDGTWDPCAVVFGGKVRLYWNGHNNPVTTYTCDSLDGVTFSAPVSTGVQTGVVGLIGLGATLYMLGAAALWTSADGVTFGAPVAHNLGAPQSTSRSGPDSAAVDTYRLFYQAPYLYVTYGGTPDTYAGDFQDWPEGICLARATAPFTAWEKHPANPVLLRGPVGGFDGGATWSGSYLRVNGRSWLFYEGVGGTARDTPYQGFGAGAFSQVGVAAAPLDATLADWSPDTLDLPPGAYTIQNIASGRYLGASGTATGSGIAQYALPQRWDVWRDVNGYTVLSLEAGAAGAEVLDDPGASQVAGAALDLYPPPAAPSAPYLSQEYKLAPQLHLGVGDGVYALINRFNGFAVEVGAPIAAEAAPATFQPWRATLGQMWRFRRVS